MNKLRTFFKIILISSIQNVTQLVALDNQNQTITFYKYRLCMMTQSTSNGSVKSLNNYDNSFNDLYLAANSFYFNLTALNTMIATIFTMIKNSKIYQPQSKITITPESSQTIKSMELIINQSIK
jgi:hypothetical protein